MERRKSLILLAVVCISLSLNLLTFVIAYPETFKIDAGCCAQVPLAKDFSAYYTAGWRLFHDPSNVYVRGSLNDGQSPILPKPESFKYAPSFLLFIIPYLALDYQSALTLFDIVQFALLIPLALMIYRLLEEKHLAVISTVLVVALLLPFPIANWGASASYYWQWAEGQSKVLDIFLIVLACYLGKNNKPILSGIFFGLSFFDPRFSILSIPLFLSYNREKLGLSSLTAVASLAVSNLPLLYPGIGTGFIQMILGGGLETPLYPYAYIPLMTILALSIANWKEISRTFAKLFGRRSKEEGLKQTILTP